MKEIAKKLKKQEVIMSKEKGAFDLFALFLREDAPDKWDIVVAAKWIKDDKPKALKYISMKLQKSLTKNQLLKLSRIAIIDESNPALEAFQRAFAVEHGMIEIQDSNFFGMQIKHVYLITSQRRSISEPNDASDKKNIENDIKKEA